MIRKLSPKEARSLSPNPQGESIRRMMKSMKPKNVIKICWNENSKVWTSIWIINRRHVFFELTEEGIFIRCQRCFYQTDSVLCISLSLEEVFVLETIEILFLEY